MSTGKDCTDNELCTYHNLQCAYPDCAYGRAQKAQTAKTHEVAARIRVAEAAVVAAAEVWDDTWTIASVDDHASSWNRHHEARNALVAAVTALHAARQGVGA
jgi:hypothetical protein